MVKNLAVTTTNTYNDVIQYLGQLMFGAEYKLPFALLCTLFTKYFFGDVVVLNIYFIFLLLDLALGSWWAASTGQFTRKKLWDFVKKIMTFAVTIYIVGCLAQMIYRNTGEVLILVNWTIFVFACAEALSITENLERLGFSVPVLNVILKYGRRKSFKVIAEAFDSPEMVDELERATGGKVKIVRVREDDAKEGTDHENHDN